MLTMRWIHVIFCIEKLTRLIIFFLYSYRFKFAVLYDFSVGNNLSKENEISQRVQRIHVKCLHQIIRRDQRARFITLSRYSGATYPPYFST